MSSGSNAPCYKTSPSLARLCWKQRQFESSFAAEQALRHFPNTRLHFLENSQRKSSALSEILPLPQLLSTDLQGDPGGNVSVFLSERVISSCSLCNSPIVAGSHPHLSSETGQVVEAGGSWLISNEDKEKAAANRPSPAWVSRDALGAALLHSHSHLLAPSLGTRFLRQHSSHPSCIRTALSACWASLYHPKNHLPQSPLFISGAFPADGLIPGEDTQDPGTPWANPHR